MGPTSCPCCRQEWHSPLSSLWSVTSPSYDSWSKIIKSDTAMTGASFLSTCGWKSIRLQTYVSSVLLRTPWPDPLPPRVHFTCSTLSPSFWNSEFLKASLVSKDWGKGGIHYLSLFCVLCNQAPCLIQQWAQIVLSLPFVAYLVFFDTPEQIQFCLDFSIPNFNPGWSDSVPVFLPDCMSLLPHSVRMLLSCVWPGATCSFMQTKFLFIHFCPSSYSLGWTTHELGRILSSFLGSLNSLFPPGPYHMGLFQADL